MGSRHDNRVRVLDVAGASLMATCAVAFVWLTVLRPGGPGAEIETLARAIESANDDLTALQGVYAAQRMLVEAREQTLLETGKLPDRAPDEEDLNALSELAHAHRLDVVRVTPKPSRAYSGLLERRYAIEARGTGRDFIRFFRAVEDASLWDDIAYVRMERVDPLRADDGGDVLAVLTFSFFSAAPPSRAGEPPKGAAGTP
ncbi:MAG: hypothetical protein ACE5E6_05025 [Phycisphaerae bacterium]